MKKTEKISLILLSALFIFPLIGTAVAAPPSYVGVSEGETYTWDLNIKITTLQALATDIGESLPPEIGLFESIPTIQLIAEILAVSDEGPAGPYFYVNVTTALSIGIPGTTTMPFPGGEYMNFVVLNHTSEDYFMAMFQVMGYLSGIGDDGGFAAFLFVATGLDWVNVSADLEEMFNLAPEMPNGTISALSDGFEIVFPSQMLEGATLKALGVEVHYNSKGVLSKAIIKYDGSTLLSFALSAGDDEIPGYEIPLVLGIIGIVIFGMIHHIRKRKKIIL